MPNVNDRVISLGPELPAIPERLLLAHSRGEVLFIAGAGVSMAANLPDFRELVIGVYARLDIAIHSILSSIPRGVCNKWGVDLATLTNRQAAEVNRFIDGDYDVVLGLLERRIDGKSFGGSKVRQAVAAELQIPGLKPASTHKALMKLADRGGTTTIATTNFDLLFQKATRARTETYTLGGIPRPGCTSDFSGVLHIHGALDPNPLRSSDLILSDQDFGEFYMRRRVVPDFIYDAARLYNLVLVGYSANDPPMRYLLNAVAADGIRFNDFKERFTFVGTDQPDPIGMEDWKGRGITPIHYDAINAHKYLSKTLERWAELSPINGKSSLIDKEIKRIVQSKRSTSSDVDRDLFDHFIRRSNSKQRVHFSALASKCKADLGWLDAIVDIATEKDRELS